MLLQAIRVRSSFEAAHHWPEAPSKLPGPFGKPYDLYDTDFLRYAHRHEFKVEVVCAVGHADRAVEFFQLRRDIDKITGQWHRKPEVFTLSCEQFARAIMIALETMGYTIVEVSVSEDGQNDGIAYYSPPIG